MMAMRIKSQGLRRRGRAVLALALFVGGAIAGCQVGPDDREPPMSMPATYRSPTPPATQPMSMEWWQLFNAPELTLLEETASRANPGLEAARQRVIQARQAAKSVESQYYPTIGATPSVTRSRVSGLQRTSSNGNEGPSRNLTNTTVQVPFDLSYEVDIWGRVARALESARAQADSSAADYFVVMQTLQADVAQDYFTLRSMEAQSRILQDNVKLYQDQIRLLEAKQKVGLLAPTDMVQAQVLLEETQANLVDLRRQRDDVVHAIALLTGRTPTELSITANVEVASAPIVPAGLPAELLRRRPDVAEAEHNLRGANADVGERIAEFFPKVTLTGAAGFESFDLAHALDWEARVLSITPSISIPIFEGGRLTANLAQARARYEGLYATYRGTVLTAIRDVEDSLTDLHQRTDQQAAQARAVAASREYLRLSEIQYRQGIIAYLQVIDADRTLLTNEITETQIEQQQLISTVLLIKALGGAWQSEPGMASESH